MKRILKKILVCILIMFVLNNFFISNLDLNINTSYAAEGKFDKAVKTLESLFGAVVGLLTYPIRLVAMGIFLAVDKLMSVVAYIEGGSSGSSNSGVASATLTPFDVLFNTDENEHIPLLNINFFNIGNDTESIMYKFRTAVAVWYYALRTIASAILLVVLIYVGIRMAMSTVSAEQKASYKKMLVDWTVSLVLIFLMQYIMLFVIYVNNAIVDAISALADGSSMRESIDAIGSQALKALSISAIGATVVYCMLIWQTFGLFISYFNRMLTLAFLTLISPLITLTYSIDKMGDGKAQALNTWLKEYVFTTLIQPFHCIIYMAFVNVSVQLLNSNTGDMDYQLAAAIISIICIHFIKEAEEIIRKIFAFGDHGNSSNLATGMAVAAVAAQKSKSIGKGTKKAINSTISGVKNFKNGTGAVREFLDNAKVDAIVMGKVLSGDTKGADGSEKSVSEMKSETRNEMYEKRAEKIENKKYGVSKDKNQAQIEDLTKSLMKSGYTRSEAAARARLDVARKSREANRKNVRDSKLKEKHPKIYSARGTLRKAKDVVGQSETLHELGKMATVYASLGSGLALGSAVYGSGENIVTAFTSGAAMYSGTKELLGNSTRTLKKSSDGRLSSLGATDESSAREIAHKIMSNPSKYEGTDELDKIMDEIKEELNKMGLDKNISSQIHNTIKKSIAKDPSVNLKDATDNALQAALGTKYNDRTDKLDSSANALATFTQEQGFFQDAKTAGEIGISPDAYVADVVSSFRPDNNSSSYKTDKSFINDAKEITRSREDKEEVFVAPDTAKVEEFVDSRNDRGIQETYKEMDKEIERIQKRLEEDISERERKDLIAQLNQVMAAKAKVEDVVFDRKLAELNKEMQNKINEISRTTEKNAQRKLTEELERLQAQCDKYIEEANNYSKRVSMEGIKQKSELDAQVDELRANKQKIEIAKNSLPNNQENP